ncbi:uncharacterized protein LOC106670471 isoform X2 [Cimex lectularius]|nr:uncharacterized protein LOC106670471 isoform X2 [Cimex lectularius]
MPAKPVMSTLHNSGTYLDMSRASTLPSISTHSSGDINCYEAMSEPTSTSCVAKSGKLGRKERFLWLGQTRKCWGVLIGQKLSLYSSQGETRPNSVLKLEGYQARESNCKNGLVLELFSPGNKTYQFVVQDKEELNSWIEAVNEHCGKRMLPPPPPPLPSSPPPVQELYDTPDSRIRPVTPNSRQEYESMNDSFYHIIPDHKISQEVLYKNLMQENIKEELESSYYNLVPRRTEEIYQTISETEKSTGKSKEKSFERGNENRIQAIIKAMEASIAEAQLYEPVESSQELSR